MVVVTGARGLLGSAVSRRFGEPSNVIKWSHGDHDGYVNVDVTSQGSIERALDLAGVQPDVIVHCAANPNIAACEADPAMARELNAEAVRKIAAVTRQRDIYLVYVSTDYVFAGDKEDGYAEQDPPSPLQAYGETKAAGERYCLEVADGLVVRVPLLYGIGYVLPRTTFPEQVVQGLRSGKEVRADAVEVRQPLYTVDAADVIYQLVAARARGIVHVAGQHGTTKYDWAKEIAGLLDLDAALIRPTAPSPGAKRPLRSWLRDLRLRELGIAPLRGLPAATEAFLAEAGLTQPG